MLGCLCVERFARSGSGWHIALLWRLLQCTQLVAGVTQAVLALAVCECRPQVCADTATGQAGTLQVTLGLWAGVVMLLAQ